MNIDKFIVSEDMPIVEVIKTINNNGRGIAFVCVDEKLVASISDGDIRRFILENSDLSVPAKLIANYKLHYVYNNELTDYSDYMEKESITAVPIVDKNMRIMRIEFDTLAKVYRNSNLDIPIVIMAGGKGTRLHPFTNILPKPLIPLGDMTITEHIMNNFKRFGSNQFTIIVNYKKNLIRSYFEEQKQFKINFIDEDQFLGTGGGLSLLSEEIDKTFFLTNCDILVNEDYSAILQRHKEEKNIITMVCAVKNLEVPYGVVELTEKDQVLKLIEKPNYSFMTNTGLYLIEPQFLKMIPRDTFIHITDIIQECIERGEKVGVYPINENSWIDIGNLEELERAKERIIK